MNWIDRLLMKMFPFFVLTGSDGTPYMIRFNLLRTRGGKLVLHHILRSDRDPDLHDHPWNFTSLVLWEGYREVSEGGARRLRPGQIVRHRSPDAHRLELRRPAWTLVVMSKKNRVWGFYTEDGWVNYRDYFDVKYGPGNYVAN